MSKRVRERAHTSFQSFLGWLFADMLLALALIFLLANTGGRPNQTFIPPVLPSSTPSLRLSSTPAPHALEHNYCEFRLFTSDPGVLSNSTSSAIAELEPLIRNQDVLRGRQVGIAIVGAGAPTYQQSDIDAAIKLAQQVINVLQDLGKKQFVFIGTSYYDPLAFNTSQLNFIYIQVFLVTQKGQKSETCDGTTHQPI